MLLIISGILAFLWGLGMLTSTRLDGFLHILIIFAIGLPFIQLLQRRSRRGTQAVHESRIHLNEKAAT